MFKAVLLIFCVINLTQTSWADEQKKEQKIQVPEEKTETLEDKQIKLIKVIAEGKKSTSSSISAN